jgi:hypothetical protein
MCLVVCHDREFASNASRLVLSQSSYQWFGRRKIFITGLVILTTLCVSRLFNGKRVGLMKQTFRHWRDIIPRGRNCRRKMGSSGYDNALGARF